MIARTLMTAAAMSLLAAGPTLAVTCKDDIATLERRLDSAGAQKVTGKTPAGGTTSPGSDMALDKAPSGKPSDPSVQSSASGVNEARSLLEKARSQDKAGDDKACQDTISKAKQSAGALP